MRREMISHIAVAVLVGACGKVQSGVDAATGFASSCVELGAGAADQPGRLYLDADPAKPYAVYCGADLRTYLRLEGANTSSYPAGGCGTSVAGSTAGVITTWQMVRLDTVTHAIDTGDYTFSESSGVTHESSGNGAFEHDYLRVPFGSGRSCVSGLAQTVATIDLTSTRFAIAASQVWAADGFSAETEASIHPQRTQATITATGFPAGTSPCEPNTDYYTVTGGACIRLEYVP